MKVKYETRRDERKETLAQEKKESAAMERAEHERDISEHKIQGDRPDISEHKIQEPLMDISRMHEEMSKHVI